MYVLKISNYILPFVFQWKRLFLFLIVKFWILMVPKVFETFARKLLHWSYQIKVLLAYCSKVDHWNFDQQPLLKFKRNRFFNLFYNYNFLFKKLKVQFQLKCLKSFKQFFWINEILLNFIKLVLKYFI